MSVINIYCDEQSWGEVFPGIFLVRLRNPLKEFPYESPNGVPVTHMCFALTIQNDPFLIFPEKPKPDKYWLLEDNEINKLYKSDKRIYNKMIAQTQELLKLEYILRGNFADMGHLWEAIKKDGWKQDIHGFALLYIWHKVGEYIVNHRGKRWWKRIGG